MSLTSESRSLPNESQTTHFLELGEIRNALRRRGILKKWGSDIELKSINMVIDTPLAKDYDAVAELEIALVGGFRAAVEVERSLKSGSRYREIVEEIKREKQVDLLIFFIPSFDLIFQLMSLISDLEISDVHRAIEDVLQRAAQTSNAQYAGSGEMSLLEICGMLDEK